jgi:zinc transport system ATP-binding protein
VTILGPNGSGKSTLLRALLGIVPVAEGRILREAGLRVGYVPQKLTIDRTMPITVRRFLSLPTRVSDQAAEEVLARVGMAGHGADQMIALSGGQQQRVLLARALLGKPQLLMLDEPTSGLDQPGEAAFYRLIEEVRAETGAAVLMISHDLHVVMAASDRVICLNGHICCEGTPRVVSTAPEYRALFGLGTQGALALYRHEHDHDAHEDGHPHHGHTTTTTTTSTSTTMLDDFLVRAGLAAVGCRWPRGRWGPSSSGGGWPISAMRPPMPPSLGVALALATDLPIGLGTLTVALAMAVTVAGLSARGWAMDTTLGVLAHSALAFGLVAVSFFPTVRTDLSSLPLRRHPGRQPCRTGACLAGLACRPALLAWRWQRLLTATLSEDLAHAAGINPDRERLVLVLSRWPWSWPVALKIVGALLIAAMLIIPAAAARGFARTPEAMAAPLNHCSFRADFCGQHHHEA